MRQQERTKESQVIPHGQPQRPHSCPGSRLLSWPPRECGREARSVLDGPAASVPLPAHLGLVLTLCSCACCNQLPAWHRGLLLAPWACGLFTPPPPPPWQKAERSLRLINLLPGPLLRPIFYSWTSGVLCFTRMRASIFHPCFACQHPAPSSLLLTRSRTRRAGPRWPGPGRHHRCPRCLQLARHAIVDSRVCPRSPSE